jgi:hypothetical protein
VVKYQNNGKNGTVGGEQYSGLALQRWFEVTVPLTFATFLFAGCWLYWRPVKNFAIWLLKDVLIGYVCNCMRGPVSRVEDEEAKLE